jgi:hypothetical protein
MADKVSAADGASVLKRLKITKAQRTMFIAVCLASIALGVTFVISIYFIKVIGFQGKLLTQKGYVVDALKQDQTNLSNLASQISGLTKNENLESVARTRTVTDCSGFYGVDMSLEGIKTEEELEKVRRCSSLRVIPDAMPATSQKISLDDVDTTTRVQLDLIMDRAGVDLSADSDSGVTVEETGYSGSSESSISGSILEPYNMLEASVNIDGDWNKMKSFLSTVDRTIRNFDLQQATIEIPEDGSAFTFSGSYYTYYTNPVDLQVQKRTICADAQNEKCRSAGGDQSVEKGQGGSSGNAATNLNSTSY